MWRKLFILRLYMHQDSYYGEPCRKMCFFFSPHSRVFSLSSRLSFPMVNTSPVIIHLSCGSVSMLLVWRAVGVTSMIFDQADTTDIFFQSWLFCVADDAVSSSSLCLHIWGTEWLLKLFSLGSLACWRHCLSDCCDHDCPQEWWCPWRRPTNGRSLNLPHSHQTQGFCLYIANQSNVCFVLVAINRWCISTLWVIILITILIIILIIFRCDCYKHYFCCHYVLSYCGGTPDCFSL